MTCIALTKAGIRCSRFTVSESNALCWQHKNAIKDHNGTAFKHSSGSKIWHPNRKPHQDGISVVEYPAGIKEWYLNDELHRVEYPNGTKTWFFPGKRHRVDYPDGMKIWYLDDKRHRIDGPAVEYPNGTKYWYFNNKIHRVDGPAVENSNGWKKWYLDDKLHRVDGPADEWADGTKHWFFNSKRHRVDGPAIEWADGSKNWYLDDKEVREFEYYALVKIRKFRSKMSSRILGFNLSTVLNLSRSKTTIEWYYSPDQGGGKLAKRRLEDMITGISNS